MNTNQANNMNNMNIMGSIQMLGIMNSLKTGDPTMDTALAMLLPIVLSMVLNWLNKQKDFILKMLRRKTDLKQTYRRSIASQQSAARPAGVMAGTADSEDESYNNFLIKAIGLYIHSCCKLQMHEAELKLATIGSDAVMDDEDQFVQANSRNNKTTSTSQLLKQCEIIKMPIKACWHTVGVFDGFPVRVYYEESVSNKKNNDSNESGGGSSDKSSKSMKVRLESEGEASIDCFVNTAFQWYKDELKKLENDNRYLYDFCTMNGNRNTRMTPVYTRYLLGEEKSFENLFCRKQTDSLIKMVDEFQNKTGKYGIPGFPHKLGILLHGLPGTGKTSLIKALAKYTKRQIVTVPLSRITTNHGLNAVMFNKVCTVAGLQKAVKLGQEDVIFVLEDVDASSDVVKRRDLVLKKTVEEPKASDAGKTTDGTTGEDPAVAALRRKINVPTMVTPDSLSLAGLLNALDGIVDTPGRIVIMTTNHPEFLDPALIRPGRIDKSIELGCMEFGDAKDMIEHYFRASLADTEIERLAAVFANRERLHDGSLSSDVVTADEQMKASSEEEVQHPPAKTRKIDSGRSGIIITPAEVEQLIMAEPTVEAMIAKLEERKPTINRYNKQPIMLESMTTEPLTPDGSDTSGDY